MNTSGLVNVGVVNTEYPQAQYKTVILKPNYEEGVNILTQEMLDAYGEKTKFVIRYDFILDDNIAIPDESVLEFDGGSISGDSVLTGTNTLLSGNIKCLVAIAGTFANDYLNVTWFGAVGDDDIDCIAIFKNVFSVCIASKANMYIPHGVYAFKSGRFDVGNYSESSRDYDPSSYLDCNDIKVYGDGISSTIINNYYHGDTLNLACIKNLSFKGFSVTLDDSNVPSSEPGINCVSIVNACNISFENIHCSNAFAFVGVANDGGFGFTIQSRISDNIKLKDCYVKDCYGGFDFSISTEALNREQTYTLADGCVAEKCCLGYWFRGYTSESSVPYIKNGLGTIKGSALNCMQGGLCEFSGLDIQLDVIATETTIDSLIRDAEGNYWVPTSYWGSNRWFYGLGVYPFYSRNASNNNIKVNAFYAGELHSGLILDNSNGNTCVFKLNPEATIVDIKNYTTPAGNVFVVEFAVFYGSNNTVVANCNETQNVLAYLEKFINDNNDNTVVLNGNIYTVNVQVGKVSSPDSHSYLSKVSNYLTFVNNDSTFPLYKAFQVATSEAAHGGMNAFGDILRSQINKTMNQYGQIISSSDVAGGLFIDVRDIGSVSTVLGHIPIVKKNRGTTSERVAYDMTGIEEGYCWYDTTSKQPLWWTGDTSGGKSGWVDANGDDVPNPA